MDGNKNGKLKFKNSNNNHTCRIDEYETALKDWEESRPPGSASSLDATHYKKKIEDREAVTVSLTE